MPRATCVKVTSTGGSYIGGLLGTDVVAFHRLIGYAMGSLKLAKWLLDKGSHHGKSFFRIILLDVGNRVLDFGFGKPPTIQLDGGCSIEKTASYEQLENHSLMVTEISRRFLREFQIQLTDEQIGEFVSSYEGIRELT